MISIPTQVRRSSSASGTSYLKLMDTLKMSGNIPHPLQRRNYPLNDIIFRHRHGAGRQEPKGVKDPILKPTFLSTDPYWTIPYPDFCLPIAYISVLESQAKHPIWLESNGKHVFQNTV